MVDKTVSKTKKTRKKSVTKKGKNAKLDLPQDERILSSDEVANFAESLISQEERLSMISEAAYYRAEQRGFRHGEHENDWLEAEKIDDDMLNNAAKNANF